MPNVRTNGWVRIEGCEIGDIYRQYGTFTGIPNSEQHIYYGHPEIQINNPYSDTHSVIYSVKSIENYFGYNNIRFIDANWGSIISNIQTYMDEHYVDISDPDTAYYYVGKPFTVSKSCVIFYDDSSKSSTPGSKYSHYAIILVDEYAIPNVIEITAKYNGDVVPIGEQIDTDQLEIIAIYDDGNEIKINSGYTLEPADKIVTKTGANLFTVFYVDTEDDVNTAKFIVQGCKNLQSISGYWDGGLVAYGKEAAKKFFVITAHYSDDSEATVTDFSFPNGSFVTKQNEGSIEVYYKGRRCYVEVPPFEIKQSRLIAYYNGPNVEVNHNFQSSYISVKIYYASEGDINNSYYEDINIDDCILTDTLVSKEGVNTFDVSYEGQLGLITTSFTVIGFIPDIKPTDIQVSYNGPGVYQGKTFDIERITCNIYYSDGKIKTVKNFTVSTNIVNNVGSNEINVSYTEDSTTLIAPIFINGLENDSTTGNNIFPVVLNNNFPVASILNNRYRGPAEGIKTNDYAKMIIDNIKSLYKLFENLEKQYNEITLTVAGESSVKIQTLNDVCLMKNEMNDILKDDHYTTGVYKSEDIR